MMNELKTLTNRLEKVMSADIKDARLPEPPRLVRANSAFDLYKALKRLETEPEFARYVKGVLEG